ncbi:NUDIX domain-containing protein [Paenibacillus hamazuiensis]|uniref:NUDIX domain-containing protein n=1 Tax=Paenibacillus hamazuiensis TaxID=2936508 RepID=UPI00200F98AE|nr:NUDIX domain-containing protein [Paenibacillus hamazuiensis]
MNYHIRIRACALIIENDAVLLIEFDENGIHYNLPAGGMEPGEAVRREAREEASVDVEVGPLAFVHERAPHLTQMDPGAPHQISLMFDCRLKPGSVPRLPDRPDPNQIGVKWVPLDRLHEVKLYPNIGSRIVEYARDRSRNLELIEHHTLQSY